MPLREKLIIALDVNSLSRATPIVEELVPYVGYFKVGLELIMAAGALETIKHIHSLGGKVFVDAKFNDIPNTIGLATEAICSMGVEMFDVHALAGVDAIKAAVSHRHRAICLVVTVLTSLSEEQCNMIFGNSCVEKVSEFTKLAISCHAKGIVCSAYELDAVNGVQGSSSLLKVVPGIRPSWSSMDDHQRAVTPSEAIKRGASHLVIGRPVTMPPAGVGSPKDAVLRILDEISKV